MKTKFLCFCFSALGNSFAQSIIVRLPLLDPLKNQLLS